MNDHKDIYHTQKACSPYPYQNQKNVGQNTDAYCTTLRTTCKHLMKQTSRSPSTRSRINFILRVLLYV
ncbi:hypothetical protein GYH30_041307 [Glycine max]|uniref:Uncharacterized protein n=1 Tax=Glycine max TaxID=3847 RepID=A0A0R0G408_SOYBN|nr:hypothetical protein GYH30_041307 [Glycine max]